MKTFINILLAIASFSLLTVGADNNRSLQALEVEEIDAYPDYWSAISEIIEFGIDIGNIDVDWQRDNEPEKPISFRELIEHLPDPPPGWTAKEPQGETNSFGDYSISQVNQTFYRGDQKITIGIFDSAFNSVFYTPFLLTTKFGSESTEGYSKGITIDDIPGRAEYNYARQEGSLNLLVDRRFLVQIDGHNIEEVDLRQWWQLIDRQSLTTISNRDDSAAEETN